MTQQLSIVVPFYNEAENVDSLIKEICAHMPSDLDYEIIAVNDGSTDHTEKALRSLKNPHLRCFSHEKNYGQSAAQLTGGQQARFPWLITMDGDGQNPPQDLILFINKLMALNPKSDDKLIINGNRKAVRKDKWLKKFSSSIANKYRHFLLQDHCPDSGCCYRLMDRATFLAIPHFKNFHRFIPALFIRQGATLHNIPIGHRPRERGQSSYGVLNRLFVGIVDTFAMVWLKRRPCAPRLKKG